MSRWLYLSYPIHTNTPIYGNAEPFLSVPVRSINDGDICNTQRWTLTNHLGTHIDFPRHFVENGITFKNYPPDFWICRNLGVIDLSPVLPEYIITPENLHMDTLPHDLELLFIKTGFSRFRQDPSYVFNNPVFVPGIASALRKQCPHLRIFGFDTISLSSWTNRSLGREAHKAFLDHDNPILILEDVDLSAVDQKTDILQVIVAPLAVYEADAAPCLILSEVS